MIAILIGAAEDMMNGRNKRKGLKIPANSPEAGIYKKSGLNCVTILEGWRFLHVYGRVYHHTNSTNSLFC